VDRSGAAEPLWKNLDYRRQMLVFAHDQRAKLSKGVTVGQVIEGECEKPIPGVGHNKNLATKIRIALPPGSYRVQRLRTGPFAPVGEQNVVLQPGGETVLSWARGDGSAVRGKADFAGFAPTKAAQRILAESMARHLGPQGVHVAYVVIDAVIDLPWTRQMMHARLGREPADDFFITPQAIADEVWHLVQQPRAAWSFNVEIRPFGEPW